MRIIEMKKNNENNLYLDLTVESVNDERFELRETIFLDKEKYVIVYSKRLNPDDYRQPKYDITIKKIIRQTFYNYDHIDFYHTIKIIRENPTKIKIVSCQGHYSELGFMDAETCLKDYNLLGKMWREANGSMEKDRLGY